MTAIAIIPDAPGSGYRAIAGAKQASGQTAGQALDALSQELDETERGTLVVVQHFRPDRFFTAAQQQRLQELMARWRTAIETGAGLPAPEQAELAKLVEAEIRAAAERAASLVSGSTS